VPARAPFDLWDRNAKHGIKLYVRRVFIMDDAEQLMPTYLRFVRGVVDSADLPLNVSREILQESKDIEAIRKGCTAKVLGLLESLANSDEAAEKEKYAEFWGEFGKVLKEGMGEDFANKDKIAGLLRFASTKPTRRRNRLARRLHRPHEGRQEKIYYVTAETFNAAKNSPHLEVFRKKGIEVLLLSDRVDEWVVSHLTEFEGKALVSVAKGGLDLGQAGRRGREEGSREGRRRVQGAHRQDEGKSLGERVKEVRVTHAPDRLSPACLVADEHDLRQPGAHPQGGRPEGANVQAHPRNQPQAPGGAAPEVRREEVRRLGGGAVRPGPARRGRPARRPGDLRQAHQPADAGDERRLGRHQPCRHTGESRCPVP
jgi:molecular chaperone HtpG